MSDVLFVQCLGSKKINVVWVQAHASLVVDGILESMHNVEISVSVVEATIQYNIFRYDRYNVVTPTRRGSGGMASRQAGRQDGVRPGVSGYAAARPRPHRCRRLLLHTGLTAPLQVHLPSAAPTTHTFLGGHDGGRTIRRDGKQAGRYGVRLLSGTSAATDVDGCCCTQGTQLLCRCTCPL